MLLGVALLCAGKLHRCTYIDRIVLFKDEIIFSLRSPSSGSTLLRGVAFCLYMYATGLFRQNASSSVQRTTPEFPHDERRMLRRRRRRWRVFDTSRESGDGTSKRDQLD